MPACGATWKRRPPLIPQARWCIKYPPHAAAVHKLTWCRAKTRWTAHARTFAAIEIACLDLIGKAVGKPVCDVIGGRARDAVSFSAYLFYKHGGGGGVGDDAREDEYGEVLDPQACVRECRQMIAQYGFREIKLKGGVLDPDSEIASIRALRQEFGAAYPLRIDPNCAWSVETSLRVGRELESELSAGGYLEDPCATLEGMAEVRRRLLAEDNHTPQASNVAVTCFADVPRASDLDAVQIVLSDPHYWGGLRNVQYLSHLTCGARHGPFHALQQSSGRQPDGHDPRRRGLPQPDLRLRHPLSLADARATKWWKAAGFRSSMARCAFPTSPAWA